MPHFISSYFRPLLLTCVLTLGMSAFAQNTTQEENIFKTNHISSTQRKASPDGIIDNLEVEVEHNSHAQNQAKNELEKQSPVDDKNTLTKAQSLAQEPTTASKEHNWSLLSSQKPEQAQLQDEENIASSAESNTENSGLLSNTKSSLFATSSEALNSGAKRGASGPLAEGGLNSIGGVVQWMVSTFGVLGFILFLAYILRRSRFVQRAVGSMRVEGQLALGQKERVVRVEIEGRHLLLGVTANSINLLIDFDAERLAGAAKQQNAVACSQGAQKDEVLSQEQSSASAQAEVVSSVGNEASAESLPSVATAKANESLNSFNDGFAAGFSQGFMQASEQFHAALKSAGAMSDTSFAQTNETTQESVYKQAQQAQQVNACENNEPEQELSELATASADEGQDKHHHSSELETLERLAHELDDLQDSSLTNTAQTSDENNNLVKEHDKIRDTQGNAQEDEHEVFQNLLNDNIAKLSKYNELTPDALSSRESNHDIDSTTHEENLGDNKHVSSASAALTEESAKFADNESNHDKEQASTEVNYKAAHPAAAAHALAQNSSHMMPDDSVLKARSRRHRHAKKRAYAKN